jgi:excinuclease ABC subunit C
VDDLKAKVKNFPNLPGVYLMYSDSGKVIYVGKAKKLVKRVLSYFNQASSNFTKTQSLMEHCKNIEFTVTSSENEALLLEANLIKQYRPRYNVLLRDDKSYPYLYLSTQDEFPRLDLYRGSVGKRGRYYGPFTSIGAVRENLNLLQKVFRLRQCGNAFFKSRKRPCLQYQIGRCTAPCVGAVSAKDYAKQVELLELFMSGKSELLLSELEREMLGYANNRNYELAAGLRDQIAVLRSMLARQSMVKGDLNVDVVAACSYEQSCVVSILFVRAGRVLGQKPFHLRASVSGSLSEVVSDFISQYYLARDQVFTVDRIVTAELLGDKDWLESVLQQKYSAKLRLIHNASSYYNEWCLLAQENAKQQLNQKLISGSSVESGLVSLKQELALPYDVARVECYDISHTFGAQTVASCVVFDRGGPQKKSYRRFNIEGITAGDDYAAMKQVLRRRYAYLKKANMVLPDLCVIDGGLGQMKQAVAVFEELQISGVMILAVAKGASRKPGREKLMVHGAEKVIQLPLGSPAMNIIQTVRDEAHRFAISGHRAQRKKALVRSELEGIPGIGGERRRALLKYFGGRQGLLNASLDQLKQVPGLGAKLAQLVYDYIHKS